MDLRQRTKRFGLCVVLCACLLRLAVEGAFQKGLRLLLQQDPVPIHTYSETGRTVRFSASSEDFWEHVRESPPPRMPEPDRPVFSRADAQQLSFYNTGSRKPDPEALLETALDWDLTAGTPAVLILHTHGTESYTPDGEPYEAVSAYRTLDDRYNMISIGDAVAEILEENGIGVIHDRQIYDYPSYNGAYTRARESIEAHLAENPGIQLVLDLHRDASGSGGRQLRTKAQVNGEPSAQLMFVQGTNFDTWTRNLSLAAKLQVLLEQKNPGIMRPVNLRAQRFNQDLSPGMLLVEVGAAGNSRREALLAAGELAGALVSLAEGSRFMETVNE